MIFFCINLNCYFSVQYKIKGSLTTFLRQTIGCLPLYYLKKSRRTYINLVSVQPSVDDNHQIPCYRCIMAQFSTPQYWKWRKFCRHEKKHHSFHSRCLIHCKSIYLFKLNLLVNLLQEKKIMENIKGNQINICVQIDPIIWSIYFCYCENSVKCNNIVQVVQNQILKK